MKWVGVTNPESTGLCTANSVMDEKLIGIYHPSKGLVRSYLAVISPSPFASES